MYCRARLAIQGIRASYSQIAENECKCLRAILIAPGIAQGSLVSILLKDYDTLTMDTQGK